MPNNDFFDDDDDEDEVDEIVEQFRKIISKINFDNINFEPNQPRCGDVLKALAVFEADLRESCGDNIKVSLERDDITSTCLMFAVRGEVISIDDVKSFIDVCSLANTVEICSLTTGESEIGFTFEDVWNIVESK